jgi:hypothetical protein
VSFAPRYGAFGHHFRISVARRITRFHADGVPGKIVAGRGLCHHQAKLETSKRTDAV